MIQNLIHHAAGTADSPSLKHLPSGGSVRPRRARTGLAITVVSAVAVMTAGCASSSTSSPAAAQPTSSSSGAIHSPAAQPTSSSSGTVHFPATLFGLPQNTGATGQQIAREVMHGLAMIPIYSHPRIAVYGDARTTGRLIIVGISGLSAAFKKYGAKPSAAGLRRGLLIMGATDVQTFPAGKGAMLGCGHLTRSGITAAICMRYSKKDIGMATYLGTIASNLRDAAAKTSQAIASSGG